MYKYLFPIFVAALFFSGCSKSSNTTKPASAAIIGKWNLVSDSVTQYTSGKRDLIDIDTIEPGEYRQFNADGSGVDYSPAYGGYPEYSIKLTYTVSGNKVSFNYPSYSAYGFDNDARTDVYTILKLDNNTLGIEYSDVGTNGSLNQYYWYSK